MAETTPFHYEFQRYCDAQSAAHAAFGEDTQLLDPLRPPQPPSSQPGLTVEQWVESARRQLDVSYDLFAFAAVAKAANILLPPKTGDIFRDFASLKLPLPEVKTSAGDLPASIVIDDLSLGNLPLDEGNRIFGLSDTDDRTRAFFPQGFNVSTEVGDLQRPVKSNLLEPARRHTVARYSASHHRGTGFVVPWDHDGYPITLPARGRGSYPENTRYSYVAGLTHVALKHIFENGADGVDIDPGQLTTIDDVSVKLSQRTYVG